MSTYSIPKTELPVKEIVEGVLRHFENEHTLIVKAPPGAGKSTLLPLIFLNASWSTEKKIIVLEPRRLAAKTIATRMSQLLGEQVGGTVGYRIRFESKVSKNTRIEVVTEGILTRMIQSDKTLQEVAIVVFDEFHERSIHTDLALALCREAQQTLRPDLKLLIMSATIDLPELSRLLNSKIIESEGRMYPVQIHYTGESDVTLLPELTKGVLLRAIKETEGDILVFLPGQGEILQCKELLKDLPEKIVVHSLYGQLPFNQQQAALMPDKNGKRKIVLATSIAETSLTIQGVTTVVDGGYGKRSVFDPATGLSRLETVRISKDAAEQRAGRAGRLSAGTCYRLWTEENHDSLEQHHQPEIETADLSGLVLEMAIWGISNINSLAWMSVPPSEHVRQAKDGLRNIEAIANNKVTEHGKKIHQLPCHPRIAHMLLMAKKIQQEKLATDVAAIIEEKDPIGKEAGVSINERITALRRFRTNDGKGRAFGLIDKVANSYRSLLNIEPENDEYDPSVPGLLLAYAFPERIASARVGSNALFQLANGKFAQFHGKDPLATEHWIAVAHVDDREGTGKIFMAAPLDPQDLKELVRERNTIDWDSDGEQLSVRKELRIGQLKLKSTQVVKPDRNLIIECICKDIANEGESILYFSEECQVLQEKIKQARKQFPKANFPDVQTSTLLENCAEWLPPYLAECTTKAEVMDLDLVEIITNMLNAEQKKIITLFSLESIQS